MGRVTGRAFLLVLVLLLALQTPASAKQKTYVIYFLTYPANPSSLLKPITSQFSILYEFRAINAIGVKIDESFLTRLQKIPGVLKVVPGSLLHLHTTHSWDFLGLVKDGKQTDAWSSAEFGAGTIIGNVDTGVWPTHQSFQADGSDIPWGWSGRCANDNDTAFQCNNKLIGARVFNEGINAMLSLSLPDDLGKLPSMEDLSSPRDFDGHGSHTLSTAAGSFVRGAGVFGHGQGTAAGGSPRARVAAYKACYSMIGCSDVDVLAAIYAAVADGVHVLSMSLGSDVASGDYLTDLVAMGTFFAVQSGVTVVCSAGNNGPGPETVTNVAPWIFTVGASTMDRDFPAFVHLGNSLTIQGQSLAPSTQPLGQAYPIVSGEKANAANQPTSSSSLCLPGSLDRAKVAGKIVVCVRGVIDKVEKGLVVKQAGGVGMVLCNGASFGDSVIPEQHLVAAAHCSYSQCLKLFDYLRSNRNPSGYINATDASFGVKPAPKMAAFSSRGPNPVTPQILKPDITAPGVSVIAAHTGATAPTELPFDNRRVAYNIQTGTSMACPHVAGVVGLLKTKYPTWTPAMIKSAIMTTATTVANDGNPIQDEAGGQATPFSYGSGHLNPVEALDPGLVYDTTMFDYINFLCSVKLTQDLVPNLLDLVNLPVIPPNLPVNDSIPDVKSQIVQMSQDMCGLLEDMNYPSITVPCLSRSATVNRRLTNVGGAPGKYKVTVTKPAGVDVTVVPNELYFEIGEEKEFMVKLDVVDAAAAADYVFGSIVWSDGAYGPVRNKVHRVRSPIVVKTNCE